MDVEVKIVVAYFKQQNKWFLAAGAAAALLLVFPLYKNWLPQQEFYMKAFYLAVPVFAGIAVGRVFSGWWAGKRLSRMDSVLYHELNPKGFIESFLPRVEGTPKETAEYVNGRVKLAYAYGLLGDFEESRKQMEGLHPENLHLHALAAASLMANQMVKTSLWSDDRETAENYMEILKSLRDAASERAKTLAESLKNCIRLNEVWIDFVSGKSIDDSYVEEEMNLAVNRAYRTEMQLLLGKMKLEKGDLQAAEKLLEPLAELGKELYPAREAARLLGK